MLSETIERIENLPGELYDLDLARSGAWIGAIQRQRRGLRMEDRIKRR